MKISSWNVNSVRARIINILNYLKDSEPDIFMIQEIKAEEKNFPFNDFKNLGYESHVFGQKVIMVWLFYQRQIFIKLI